MWPLSHLACRTHLVTDKQSANEGYRAGSRECQVPGSVHEEPIRWRGVGARRGADMSVTRGAREMAVSARVSAGLGECLWSLGFLGRSALGRGWVAPPHT